MVEKSPQKHEYKNGFTKEELEIAIDSRKEKLKQIRQKIKADPSREAKLMQEVNRLNAEIGQYQEILDNPIS